MPTVSDWITSLFKIEPPPEGQSGIAGREVWKMPLSEAVREASSLLAFASRRGIPLEPSMMKTIIEMAKLVDNGTGILSVDTDKEQAFWEAYSSVVAKIHPVTSDSINATLDSHHSSLSGHVWSKRNIAQRTVFKYGLYSLVVLVAIICFQSYMQMGMTVRDHLMSSFKSQKQAIDALFTAKIADEDNRLKAAGKEGQENYVRKMYERYIVELQLAKLQASQDEMLSWDKTGGKVLIGLGLTTDDEKQEPLQNYTNILSEGGGSGSAMGTDLPSTAPAKPSQDQTDATSLSKALPGKPDIQMLQQPQLHDSYDDLLILSELKSVVIPTYLELNQSEQTLRLISEFILPLLYGLLGACVYVLRDLTNTISSVTFSKATLINYNLRLIMGPLVGIAVGLFLGSSTSNLFLGSSPEANPSSLGNATSMNSLSTVGFAFLAGYSVEVLFSALDKLVSAFVRKGSAKMDS